MIHNSPILRILFCFMLHSIPSTDETGRRLSAYEQERLVRIQRNNAKLEALGLTQIKKTKEKSKTERKPKKTAPPSTDRKTRSAMIPAEAVGDDTKKLEGSGCSTGAVKQAADENGKEGVRKQR